MWCRVSIFTKVSTETLPERLKTETIHEISESDTADAATLTKLTTVTKPRKETTGQLRLLPSYLGTVGRYNRHGYHQAILTDFDTEPTTTAVTMPRETTATVSSISGKTDTATYAD